MARLTIKAVAEQIEIGKGNLAAVARAFKVSRQAVDQFVKRNPPLGDALRDARESMLDDAESALYTAVNRCEGWAVCFFLKTQGRTRGYQEKDRTPLEQLLALLDPRLAALLRTAIDRELDAGGTVPIEPPAIEGNAPAD